MIAPSRSLLGCVSIVAITERVAKPIDAIRVRAEDADLQAMLGCEVRRFARDCAIIPLSP